MRENCTSGSVRGAPGNRGSYRERLSPFRHICRDSVDNIPRLWRYLLCEEALSGLPDDLKARLKAC